MNFVNTTPHDIKIYSSSDKVLATFKASSTPIRVDEIMVSHGTFPFYDTETETTEQVPLTSREYTAPIINFPLDNGTKYICSRVVKKAIERHYPFISNFFIVPTDVIKDNNGYVYGCRAFSV